MIPMKLNYLNSFEQFDGLLGFRLPGGNNTNNTANNTIPTATPVGSRLLQGSSINNPNSTFLKNLRIPPYWKSDLPV